MLRLLCCCCRQDENSAGERDPLLQHRPLESARQTRPVNTDALSERRRGRLAMRRVCILSLDEKFSDIAETFNEQQESYESMLQHISSLQQCCGSCSNDPLALADSVRKIRQDHATEYRVSLQMKGYGFSLNVVPLESGTDMDEWTLPSCLLSAQDELKIVSQSVKATISVGTKLQEMIGWLLRSEEQWAEQVTEATTTYQEQRRLGENFRENMKEVRRAKELSLKYREQAGKVLTAAAEISGVQM